jgi:hypothetical protein
MAVTVGGFELEEGQTITDMDQWPSFAEWWEREYGFAPMVIAGHVDSKVKEIFEAYLAGAYWQWHRSTFGGEN